MAKLTSSDAPYVIAMVVIVMVASWLWRRLWLYLISRPSLRTRLYLQQGKRRRTHR